MIRILSDPVLEKTAGAIAEILRMRLTPDSPPLLISEATALVGRADWDDLLVVVYGSSSLPAWTSNSIESYRIEHPVIDGSQAEDRISGFILPVATKPDFMRPPPPIDGIKAVLFDGSREATERLVRGAGALLGTSLRPAGHQIFISYRSTDGGSIAREIHDRLQAAGFDPWLDEADDNLPPGIEVQDKIMSSLKKSCLLIVVDTVDAMTSLYMKYEIDAAIASLIPVLPVVIGPDDLSHFIALRPLQRRAAVKPAGIDGGPLSSEEWGKIERQIGDVLTEAYRRRRRTIFHAERVFKKHGFDWEAVDDRKRMYRSKRERLLLPDEMVVSHCCIHDAFYIPALKSVRSILNDYRPSSGVNQKICIYSDRVLSVPQILTIKEELDGLPFILVNCDELEILVSSNFARIQ